MTFREPKYYRLNANKLPVECSLMEWAQHFTAADRHVADEEVGGCRVSTVFLGIDHRHFGDGPPILFETLVFGGKRDGEMHRYSTWDDAVAGHASTVERVRTA